MFGSVTPFLPIKRIRELMLEYRPKLNDIKIIQSIHESPDYNLYYLSIDDKEYVMLESDYLGELAHEKNTVERIFPVKVVKWLKLITSNPKRIRDEAYVTSDGAIHIAVCEVENVRDVFQKFLPKSAKLIKAVQESPDRFYYLFHDGDEQYVVIKNDFFDDPRYEIKLLEQNGFKFVKWLTESDELASIFDGKDFIDIKKYWRDDLDDTYWRYAVAKVSMGS